MTNGLPVTTASFAAVDQTSRRFVRRVGCLLTSVMIAVSAGCGGSNKPAPVANASPSIAFVAARALDGSDALGTPNIWVVNVDGSGTAPLTRLTNAVPFTIFTGSPKWSPDGSKLGFESSRAFDGSNNANVNGTTNLWLINADGSNATPITRITSAGIASSGAVWSPDGKRLAYNSLRALDGSDGADLNATFNVWVANSDGSGSTPVTGLTAAKSDSFILGWSKDGTKLILASGRALDGTDAANANGTANIWTINADGSGVSPLTRLTALDTDTFAAKLSPDGAKIAFMSARALDGTDAADTVGTFNVWVMNADGSGAIPLTRLNAVTGNVTELAWSPDGGKIAFTSLRALDGSDANNSAYNIWVINADGTVPTPLTKLTVPDASALKPSWSPDGKRLVFKSARALDGSNAANANNTTNIWIINADGSNPMPLTKTTTSLAGSDAPQWKP